MITLVLPEPALQELKQAHLFGELLSFVLRLVFQEEDIPCFESNISYPEYKLKVLLSLYVVKGCSGVTGITEVFVPYKV